MTKKKPLKKGILIILDQFGGKLHRSNIKRMDFFFEKMINIWMRIVSIQPLNKFTLLYPFISLSLGTET